MAEDPRNSEPGLRDSFSSMNKCKKYVVKHIYLFASLAAVVVGTALGVTLKSYMAYSSVRLLRISLPGILLLRVLKLLTTPLILTSVIIGVADLSRHIRRITVHTSVLSFLTTALAVLIGLTLVLLFEPGMAYHVGDEAELEERVSFVDTLMDLVRNLVPNNLITAFFQQYKTTRLEFPRGSKSNTSLKTNDTVVKLAGHYVEGANTLGMIVVSFVFGLSLKKMGERAQIVIDIIVGINAVSKYLVNMFLCYLPFGLLSIIAGNIFGVEDWETLKKLTEFILLVIFGLLIHGCVALPALYFVITRRNPWHLVKGVSPALCTAMIISSSSASMPVTLRCCVEENKIDRRLARFVLPVLTTVNMDGSALYEVIAVVFLAQLGAINLDWSQMIAITVLSVLSSVVAAGIPAAGAVTTLFVLSAVGLPSKDVSVLFAVEWLLDRCNTVVNVLSDSIIVAIVQHLSQKELEEVVEGGQESPRTPSNDAEGHARIGGSISDPESDEIQETRV